MERENNSYVTIRVLGDSKRLISEEKQTLAIMNI